VADRLEDRLDRAAAAVTNADTLLITAGAGIGVDSGLPDFRGDEGFWRAYPPMRALGISFVDMANPSWFQRDPELAWGFYGHRLNLYRATDPHSGFATLRRWSDRMQGGHFVFTSNVDGQFQTAGFDDRRILECHGSIHHLQCTEPCGTDIWRAVDVEVRVDDDSFRARPPLPTCPNCDSLARPNVLMFGDWSWNSSRSNEQQSRFSRWLDGIRGANLVVVEVGAGTAVPTVRITSERTVGHLGGTLIRINLREPHVPGDHIGLPLGGLEALTAIDERLSHGSGPNSTPPGAHAPG
jgi:NAD-dependent SIR2 family protein deacetylase